MVTVSQLGVNDEVAEVVQWYVPDEGKVSAGWNICALETTKALYEISAETDGYIVHLVQAGVSANIGQAIALIGPDLESLKSEKEQFMMKTEKGSVVPSTRENSTNRWNEWASKWLIVT